MKLHPVNPNHRIVSLDIIRGFALFGIFLVNMPTFQWPDLINQLYMLPYSLSEVDHWIRLFFDLFVQGKFYTIFSFLFGVGFYLFMNKVQANVNKGYHLFIRRMLILALFGFIHLVFLWYGDILLTYAVAGMFLVLFYRRKLKTILVWIGLLLISFAGLMGLNYLYLKSVSKDQLMAYRAIGEDALREAIAIYQQASIGEWLAWRFTHEVVPVLENLPFAVLSVLFMFLIGLVTAKRGVIQQPGVHQSLLRRVVGIGIILSLPFNIVIVFIHLGVMDFGLLTPYVRQILASISGVFLSLVYIAIILLLLQKERWLKRLKPLGYAGRMALTNYIGQTLIGVFLYTGFGLYGQHQLGMAVLIVLAVYCLQIVFSSFWLKRYRFGPLEWVWRTLTYGQIQPMKAKGLD
jgi:uncharacterized protein